MPLTGRLICRNWQAIEHCEITLARYTLSRKLLCEISVSLLNTFSAKKIILSRIVDRLDYQRPFCAPARAMLNFKNENVMFISLGDKNLILNLFFVVFSRGYQNTIEARSRLISAKYLSIKFRQC